MQLQRRTVFSYCKAISKFTKTCTVSSKYENIQTETLLRLAWWMVTALIKKKVTASVLHSNKWKETSWEQLGVNVAEAEDGKNRDSDWTANSILSLFGHL